MSKWLNFTWPHGSVLFCHNYISEKTKKTITSKIKKELAIKKDDEILKNVYLKKVDLSLHDQENHVKGVLSSFLEKKFPNCNFRVGVIYNELFNEIKRKTNIEIAISTIEDIRNISINKNYFEKILNSIVVINNFKDRVHLVENSYMGLCIGAAKIKEMRLHSRQIEIDLLDSTNYLLPKIYERAKDLMCSEAKQNPHFNIYQVSQCVAKHLAVEFSNNIYDYGYLKVLAMIGFYDD